MRRSSLAKSNDILLSFSTACLILDETFESVLFSNLQPYLRCSHKQCVRRSFVLAFLQWPPYFFPTKKTLSGRSAVKRLSARLTGESGCGCVYRVAAEQKARTTYDNILRLIDDPDVCAPIKFLRQREVVHFQRFGEALRITQDKLNSKNFYAFNPGFDKCQDCGCKTCN